ncbi:hypothetical protein [Halobaculum lipolyticum]|uniref:SipW-cognate class signal peptide n=1 Tax=Halobaculum lipolyticum TaxID=3032001 RepID=A0ABD5WDX0_9EURY|nr:hypothetical protein [Halobaculum sp. DT31]
MTHLTRRGVLTALGVAGLSTVAGARLAGGDRPSFARYTVAQATDGPGALRVSWYETYNGTPIDSPEGDPAADAADTLDPASGPSYVEDAPGAVVSLGNVVPGDGGSVVVGLQAVEADLNVWFRPVLTANDENGQNEPEELAEGVDTDGVGELGAATNALFWLDNSVVFGACDGRPDLFEPQVSTPDGAGAAGTFVDVVEAFETGVRLPFDGADGCPDALPMDGNRCVGFRWAIPDDVGNEIQSDSLEFDLQFAAVSCGDDANPFEVAQ